MAMTKAQKEIAVTSQLARMELGNGPWIYHSCGERVSDSIDLYIDTFVVGKDAQGLGIGKMLFAKIKENMFMDRIFSMKLMTQRERPAYKIYKHLGFKEIEEYVHMSRW